MIIRKLLTLVHQTIVIYIIYSQWYCLLCGNLTSFGINLRISCLDLQRLKSSLNSLSDCLSDIGLAAEQSSSLLDGDGVGVSDTVLYLKCLKASDR